MGGIRFPLAACCLATFLIGLGGCRNKSRPASDVQMQANSEPESDHPPCNDGPNVKLSEDATMLRRVQKEGILPKFQNMTPANVKLAQKNIPALSALLGFYGDPQEPSVKSMADFADMANNPHAQKVLGRAFAQLDENDGSGAADTESKMSETEQQYFAIATSTLAYVAENEGQEAARLEVPLIGTSSTMDSRSYLNLMLHESSRLRIAMNGMPDNHRALWWLEYRTSQLIAKLNAGCR